MTVGAATRLLAQEARALRSRLERVQPFALLVPMVPAAAVPPAAQTAIERVPGRGPARVSRPSGWLSPLALRPPWAVGVGRPRPSDASLTCDCGSRPC